MKTIIDSEQAQNYSNSVAYVECLCSDQAHTLKLFRLDDEPDTFVTMHLSTGNVFVRLWRAVKYVLGFKSRFGDFEEVVWDPHTARKVAEFLRDV